MAPSSYVASLLPRIRVILGSSDLSTISAKAVRKTLISRGEDADTIKQYRNEIDEEIGKIYDDLSATTPPPRAQPTTSTSSNSHPQASPQIPQSSQPEQLSKPKIKTESDHKPKLKHSPQPRTIIEVSEDGDGAESDGAIARRLQREFDMLDSGRSRRPGTTKVQKKKKKVVSKKRVRGDGDDEDGEGGEAPKKKRGGGGGVFNKELILSDTLAALLNVPRLSRPQVVKQIWEHIKANNLQDPSDRRMILCDEPMRAVFHTDRLHMFTMNKLLVPHVMDPDLVLGQSSASTNTNGENKPAVKTEVKPEVVVQNHDDSQSDGSASEDGYE